MHVRQIVSRWYCLRCPYWLLLFFATNKKTPLLLARRLIFSIVSGYASIFCHHATSVTRCTCRFPLSTPHTNSTTVSRTEIPMFFGSPCASCFATFLSLPNEYIIVALYKHAGPQVVDASTVPSKARLPILFSFPPFPQNVYQPSFPLSRRLRPPLPFSTPPPPPYPILPSL